MQVFVACLPHFVSISFLCVFCSHILMDFLFSLDSCVVYFARRNVSLHTQCFSLKPCQAQTGTNCTHFCKCQKADTHMTPQNYRAQNWDHCLPMAIGGVY